LWPYGEWKQCFEACSKKIWGSKKIVQRIENALDQYRSEAYWQIVVTTQHRNDGASSDRVYDDLTKLYLFEDRSALPLIVSKHSASAGLWLFAEGGSVKMTTRPVICATKGSDDLVRHGVARGCVVELLLRRAPQQVVAEDSQGA
jgi:hypothetical protein